MSGFLGDALNYDPQNHSISIPITGFDTNGDEVNAGSLSISWTSARVTFTLTVTDALRYGVDINFSSIDSLNYIGINDPDINRDFLLARMVFGPFAIDNRTCYEIGTSTSAPDSLGRVAGDISNVHILGAIDSTVPSVKITQPAANTIVTTNDTSADGKYSILGTASDTLAISGQTLPGVVESVEVQLGTVANPGVFVSANLDSSGNWILPNAQLQSGKNRLVVRATDTDGNSITTPARAFTYTNQGSISVTTALSGYDMVADKGQVVGAVSGVFPLPKGKKSPVSVTMVVGKAPVPYLHGGVTAGQTFTVKAKPALGSVFNGWVGKINNVTVLTAVTETLNFETKPNLVLTANFVPDPFIADLRGSYYGLIGGASSGERGLFKLNLSKSGQFTGKVKLGGVSLPLKGKILGSGFWTTTIKKKGGLTYTITLNLTLNLAGDRQIIGATTATGINSTFTADLNDWHIAKGADLGKVSDAFAGNYNVLLPPALTNTDTDFPAGIGFGRVNIGKLGGVKFVGKLGDGTPVTAGTKLAERNSGAVVFPLFLALDKSRGNVSGIVAYDHTQPSSDLTAALDWAEPLTTGTDPEAFTGKVALHGSLYVKPTAGERIILQTAGGIGKLTLNAPAYTKPPLPVSTDLALNFSTATLDTTKQSVGPLGAELVVLKFDSKTGLFTGSYKDPLFKKRIPFFGAASRKANSGAGEAGGFFTRGNRSGGVRFGP